MTDHEAGPVRDVTPGTGDDHASTNDHDEKSAIRQGEDSGVQGSEPSKEAVVQDKPYSVFTTREKWFLVMLCGIAGMYRFVFSPGLLDCSFD